MKVRGLSCLLCVGALVAMVAGCGPEPANDAAQFQERQGWNLELPLVLDGDRLGVSSLDGSPPVEIAGPADYKSVQFDAQGRLLFVQTSGRETGFFRVEGGRPQLVIPLPRAWPGSPAAAWSPDGSKAAWLEGDNTTTRLIVEEPGGEARTWEVQEGDYFELRWSTTSDQISLSTGYPEILSYVVDVAGSAPPLRLTSGAVRAWSPSGDILLWRLPDGGGHQTRTLLLSKADGSEERPLEDMTLPIDIPVRDPPFSLDGRWVAWGGVAGGAGKLAELTIASTDGTKRLVPRCAACAMGSTGIDPAWSPDSSRFAWSQDGHVLVADTGVWEGRVVAEGEKSYWSPDGSKIAYYRQDGFSGAVYVQTIDDSGPETKVGDVRDGRRLDSLTAWSPDSRQFVLPMQVDELVKVVSFDPATNEVKQVPVSEHDAPYEVAPDGFRVMLNGGWKIIDMDGGMRETDLTDVGHCFDWSRGDALCVGPLGLKAMDFDTGDVKTLLTGNVESAAWSPDGSRIAFVRDQKLGMLDVATGEAATIVPDVNAAPHAFTHGRARFSWSPDGSRIAFSGNPVDRAYRGQASVYTINIDGGDLLRLLESRGGVGYVSFSPDGESLSVMVRRVQVIDAQTGAERLLYGEGVWYPPIWLDGQSLLVSDRRGVALVGLDGSVQFLVARGGACNLGLIGWVNGKVFFTETCTHYGL